MSVAYTSTHTLMEAVPYGVCPPPFFCFCTAVAARGLDIPAVDWIVQYDAPDEPTVSAAFFLFFSTTRNLRKGG